MKTLDEAEKKLLALAFLALNDHMNTQEAKIAIINLADKLDVLAELDEYADEMILHKMDSGKN